MSIVCAKNFAKFIGRPQRTRVPPRSKALTCRRALIAARRTANAVTRARRLHTRPKTLFVSLKKPAEIRRGGSKSQHDKYTHSVPAHNNTLLLRRFSRRAIALQHESYIRPAQSVGTRSCSTKRELRMNLVRGQARSSSLMNCSAYLKTLLKSKCVFRRVIPSSNKQVRVQSPSEEVYSAA